MKLTDLLTEMPQFKPEELPPLTHQPFLTTNSLDERFNLIGSGEYAGSKFFVFIAKNLQYAVIGKVGTREPDKAQGLHVIGKVEFRKPTINGFGLIDLSKSKHILQVGLAHIGPNFQREGFGMRLYTTLADAGYVIISDNLQYIGGKELWKRIARETLGDKYTVYVLDQGIVRMNGDKPVTYDESNIDDSELWSLNSEKKYTLFVLKKNMLNVV